MKLKTLMLGLTILTAITSVAQTNIEAQPTAPLAASSQIETIMQLVARGPRTDGGGNFTWDVAKQQFVLLDLHVYKNVIEVDPIEYLNKSPLFQKMKTQSEQYYSNFFGHFTSADQKRWIFIRDMNWAEITASMDCVNSTSVNTPLFHGACQSKDFVLIDLNRFKRLSGESQIGLFAHELIVGEALLFKLYDQPKSKTLTELKIQLFVGRVVSLEAVQKTYSDIFTAIFLKNDGQFAKSPLYSKNQLNDQVENFRTLRTEFCDEVSKLKPELGFEYYKQLRDVMGGVSGKYNDLALSHRLLTDNFYPSLPPRLAQFEPYAMISAVVSIKAISKSINPIFKNDIDTNLELLCK